MKANSFTSVDQYISGFSGNTKTLLKEMRKLIRETAPEAEEMISYNMPAYKQNGMLVYFAAYKSHIGFYPTASPIKVFEGELRAYKTSKGAIQFPIEKEIPSALVKKIVKYRIKENLDKSKLKGKTS